MRPAFSSPRQAVLFAAAMLLLLLLPLIVGATGRLTRSEALVSIDWGAGAGHYIRQKVFFETNDADMVFIGSSHIWNAIDTPHVQQQLSEQLHRPAEVFTLGWNGSGYDTVYAIARDLLAHRRVRTLVIYKEDGCDEHPHSRSYNWYLEGVDSDEFRGVSMPARVTLYSGAVLRTPRHLLELFRKNNSEVNRLPKPEETAEAGWGTDVTRHLGTVRNPGVYPEAAVPELRPMPGLAAGTVSPDDVVAYSPESSQVFDFTALTMPAYQLHFARKLVQLCKDRDTLLVLINIPSLPLRSRTAVTLEKEWRDFAGSGVRLVGVPNARFFSGVSPGELARRFYDDGHMNQVGQAIFTKTITPALLRVHASSAKQL